MSEATYIIQHRVTGKVYGGVEYLGGRRLAMWLDAAEAGRGAETWRTMTEALADVLLRHADIDPFDIDAVQVYACAICSSICLSPQVLYWYSTVLGVRLYCAVCYQAEMEYQQAVAEEMEAVERRGRL